MNEILKKKIETIKKNNKKRVLCVGSTNFGTCPSKCLRKFNKYPCCSKHFTLFLNNSSAFEKICDEKKIEIINLFNSVYNIEDKIHVNFSKFLIFFKKLLN